MVACLFLILGYAYGISLMDNAMQQVHSDLKGMYSRFQVHELTELRPLNRDDGCNSQCRSSL